ncbi:MAG: LptF/LptG family permease [Clostridium sp.]|nr:LptF/LptG family permease [Clostridium sp.]
MLKIKRLDLFMLKSFLPLFFMTFFICLFIVMMQFLWKFIDDLVGKGLSFDIVAELFFYASLTMVPLALPLAVLLASLMVFGNLGERFELTAMKAAGVSLIRAMAPLTGLIGLIAVGAFFFQNDVMPVAQTKMWTLVYSVRQKSPEVEIPEGVFYDQIPGYNLFVEKKNKETGMLYDLMIYNMSSGFENATTILADSGRLAISDDKTHLYLHLWDGESFENLRQAQAGAGNVPYRRESFTEKELLMKFDANFNRLDEETMRSQYIGKNISQLRATIDSVEQIIDSLGRSYGNTLRYRSYLGVTPVTTDPAKMSEPIDRPVVAERNFPEVSLERLISLDSIISQANSAEQQNYIQTALSKATREKQDLEFKSFPLSEERKEIRRHGIEMHTKFTLSIACIIFFFIGAPLGAIIRKGGLGTPLVISVVFFIAYYLIDTAGKKMAREGRLDVWEGIWLSSAVLLPLGIFFTYKAVNDSAVFNADAYMNFFRKLIGRHEVRSLEMKEVVMEEVDTRRALEITEQLRQRLKQFLRYNIRRQSYLAYFTKGYPPAETAEISGEIERMVAYLSNSRKRLVVMKLMDIPVMRNLWVYCPGRVRWVGIALALLFPVGIPLWLIGTNAQRSLRREYDAIIRVCYELDTLMKDRNEEDNKDEQTN